MNDIIQELNDLKILQTSLEWVEDLPEEIWLKYFEGNQFVNDELDVEKHRWYHLATSITKIGNQFLGVRYISEIKSELMDCGDIHHHLEFFEMLEVIKPTYIRK